MVICLAGAFTKSKMGNISTAVLIAENISTKLIGMTIEYSDGLLPNIPLLRLWRRLQQVMRAHNNYVSRLV